MLTILRVLKCKHRDKANDCEFSSNEFEFILILNDKKNLITKKFIHVIVDKLSLKNGHLIPIIDSIENDNFGFILAPPALSKID